MFDLGELEVLAGKAAHIGAADLPEDDLLRMVGEIEGAKRALDAAMAHAVGELEARGTTDIRYGHRTKQWLGANHALPRPECVRRVAVARILRTMPTVDSALAHGLIGFDHVRLLADVDNPRVSEALAGIQEELVALAQGVRFETWAREVRGLIELADQDGGHDPRPTDNRLAMSTGPGGTLHADLDLVGDWAASAKGALESEADRLFHQYASDAHQSPGDVTVPSRSSLLAMAFVELCRRGLATDRATSRAPVADITLVIHADDPGRTCTLQGEPVPPHTAAVLKCDPTLHALVVDSLGVPLDLGREIRYASRPQRRAAHQRDGGCVFPGCDAPPGWVDLHHVVHFDHDGRTDIANLASLCRHHHGVIHRRGWAMSTTDDQWFRITSPSGSVLMSQRHGRQRMPD